MYAVATIHMKLNGREGSRIEHMKYNCRILAHSYQLSALAPEEVSNSFVDNVEIAVPMYNIGLLGISKDIQDKYRQGLLTSEEEIEYQTHTILGAGILEEIIPGDNRNEYSQMMVDIAKYHHERWDGKGYPEGLSGENIPLVARILSIIKKFDMYTGGEKRCNREEAIRRIEEEGGTVFDPVLVSILSKVRKRLKALE